MKILYDHQIFTQQYYGGISRYYCELIDRFCRMPDISCTLALRYSNNENLRENPALNKFWSDKSSLLSNQIFPLLHQITHIDIRNRLLINQKESIRLLKQQNFDLFHPTYYNPYFIKFLDKKPLVITVYDMIHELFPNCFSPQDPTAAWKKQLIENADLVIAISHNTKNDIVRFTDINPDRISVTYLGNPFEFMKNSGQGKIDGSLLKFSESYLLFVGNRSGYKNFNFFIKSVTPLLKKYDALHVYCAGGGPFNVNETALLKGLDILSKVHVIKINDTFMKQLYKNAVALIFPSLYEGFGLPILEAFSCGCPVVINNSSSLPEIASYAACYIDANNSESIVQGIESVLLDPDYREELIRKGYERLNFFSWEKTARETKCLYGNLLYPE
jgi:glycosyltransferase involved in cell wall biosynthesis